MPRTKANGETKVRTFVIGDGLGRKGAGTMVPQRNAPKADEGFRFYGTGETDRIVHEDGTDGTTRPGTVGWVGSGTLHGSITLTLTETRAMDEALPRGSAERLAFMRAIRAEGEAGRPCIVALPAVTEPPKAKGGRKSTAVKVRRDDTAKLATLRSLVS